MMAVLSVHATETDASKISERKLLLALELYELSGMNTTIDAVPAATVKSFEQALDARAVPELLADLEPAELLSAVSTAYNAPDLTHSLIESIATQISQVQMEELISWYHTPLGVKVIRAEAEHSQLLHPQAFAEFQNTLIENPPNDERLMVMDRLDKAMGITDAAVDTMLNMQLAFALSVMKAAPESQAVPADTIIAQTQAQRPAMLVHYSVLSRESLLFTYQGLTLFEIEELIAVMESPAGSRYAQAVNQGLESGIFDASASLGDMVVQLYHFQQSAI